MKENILEVLLYLFEHVLAGDPESGHDPDALRAGPLVAELADAGFSASEIGKAFDWLDTLARQRPAPAPARADQPVRMYAGTELARLNADCRGLLMRLEHHGVLDASQRELVVDRAIALEQDTIDVEDLKWVVLMVLFNQPGTEAAQAWMETQMADGGPEPMH